MTVPVTSGEIRDTIRGTLDEIERAASDGLTLGDAVALLREVPRVMEAVEAIRSLPGERKREIVVEAVSPIIGAALRKVDLPWLPAAVESVIWEFVASKVVPFAVGYVCDMVARASKGGFAINEAS